MKDKELSQTRPIRPISGKQSRPDVRVELPPKLERCILPDPPTGPALVNAIEQSLLFLDVASDRITFPLYAALWRAVFGNCTFGIFVVGQSGTKKTTLIVLLQQHFGPGFDYEHQPAAWNATGNSLERLLFIAKDLFIHIDEFVPTGSKSNIRTVPPEGRPGVPRGGQPCGPGAVSSRRFVAGRDTGSGPPRHHRRGPHPGGVAQCPCAARGGRPRRHRIPILNLCQAAARQGYFAQAMAGYLRDVAGRYDEWMREIPYWQRYWRAEYEGWCRHPRTASIFADLALAFDDYLDFAFRVGAIDEKRYEQLWKRFEAALKEVVQAQNKEQKANDPVEQFLCLLASVLNTGRAHLEFGNGPPDDFALLVGWKQFTETVETKDEDGETQIETKETYKLRSPISRQIGWTNGGQVYLDPPATLDVLNRLAMESGKPFLVSERTIGKLLYARGLLSNTDTDHYTVRHTVNGAEHRVLHMNLGNIVKLLQFKPYVDREGLEALSRELFGD